MSEPRDEVITVFVTKYALTNRGVFTEEGRVTTEYSGPNRPDFIPSQGGFIHHGDWHVTKASADQRVRTMIANEKTLLVRKQLRLDAILYDLDRGKLPTAKGT